MDARCRIMRGCACCAAFGGVTSNTLLAGSGVSGAALILHSDPPLFKEKRLLFSLRPDGNLQHVESKLFVHPLKGKAYSGCPLILHEHGPEPRLAFQIEVDTSCADRNGQFRLVHTETGHYIVPEKGLFNRKIGANAALVFTSSCSNSADALFRFYTSNEMCDGPTNTAASKIQACFRGHRSRVTYIPLAKAVMRQNGNILHVSSGFYVHPKGGETLLLQTFDCSTEHNLVFFFFERTRNTFSPIMPNAHAAA